MNRYLIPVLWGVLALLPLAAGCGHHRTAAPKTARAPQIETATPRRFTLTRQVDQPGYLRPYEQARIYTKIAGYLESVDVDIGDHLEKGLLLAKLWVPEMVEDLKVKGARVKLADADLLQARESAQAAKATQAAAQANVQVAAAGIQRADADVQRWQAEYERGQKLVGRGVYDRQTLDEAQNQVRSSQAASAEARARQVSAQATFDEAAARFRRAEADVEVAAARIQVAKAEYDKCKADLDYREIRAPFAGIVTQRNVNTGDFLQSSNSGFTSKTAEPLFIMMRTDIMRVTVQVPEIDAALIQEGDQAVVRLPALPGRAVIGTVTRFSWSLDERARTLRVEIHLKNPEWKKDQNRAKELRPGMYANVRITARVASAWILPPEAILTDIQANEGRSYCFLVEDGKARKTLLQVGVRGDEGVQVLQKMTAKGWEDLTAQEAVVVSNPGALLDGQPVELKAAQTP